MDGAVRLRGRSGVGWRRARGGAGIGRLAVRCRLRVARWTLRREGQLLQPGLVLLSRGCGVAIYMA